MAVIGVVGALGVAGVVIGQAAGREHQRSEALEVRAGLKALCLGVAEHHREYGEWLSAGPQPKFIPRGPVAFPKDPTFELLGFAPGKVQVQYEVVATDAGTRCIARSAEGLVEVAAP